MGIDFLEGSPELERHIGVAAEPDDLASVWTEKRLDCTAGALRDAIQARCVADGLPFPADGWDRL